jgi:hypothetical protein
MLCKYEQQTLLNIYGDMKEVLQHNYHHLLNTRAAEPYIRKLAKTYDKQ